MCIKNVYVALCKRKKNNTLKVSTYRKYFFFKYPPILCYSMFKYLIYISSTIQLKMCTQSGDYIFFGLFSSSVNTYKEPCITFPCFTYYKN